MLATALAYALYGRMESRWLVLGWFGLVPWLAVVDRTRSWRRALAAGLVMAVVFELAVFGWFASAIETYSGAPWMVAIVLLAAMSPLLQPQLATHALARRLAQAADGDTPRFWIPALVGAAVYVGTEAVLPKLFADTLGHGLYPSLWLRQGADVAGAHGLTFALIVANECVLAVVCSLGTDAPWRARLVRASVPAAGVVAIVAALALYGAWRCEQIAVRDAARNAGMSSGEAGATGTSHAGPVTAALVQADISHYDALRAEIGTYEAVRRILDAHFALSTAALRGAPADVLVWPETVYPTTFGAPKSEDGALFDREIVSFVDRSGVPLIFGSYDADGPDEFNAAMFLEPARPTGDGAPPPPRSFQTYRKAALFPLTERVPALLDSQTVRRWLPWLGTWKSGAGTDVVAMALRDGTMVRIAPLICYDVLDPRLALAAVGRGAELIVTLSNDSWFSAGPGPRMHLIGAAFLSIETRRPQLRATNTGVSAIIDSAGTLLTTAGVDERVTLLAAVTPARGDATLMVRWGEWFGPAALAAAVAFLLGDAARRRQRRVGGGTPGRGGRATTPPVRAASFD